MFVRSRWNTDRDTIHDPISTTYSRDGTLQVSSRRLCPHICSWRFYHVSRGLDTCYLETSPSLIKTESHSPFWDTFFRHESSETSWGPVSSFRPQHEKSVSTDVFVLFRSSLSRPSERVISQTIISKVRNVLYPIDNVDEWKQQHRTFVSVTYSLTRTSTRLWQV